MLAFTHAHSRQSLALATGRPIPRTGELSVDRDRARNRQAKVSAFWFRPGFSDLRMMPLRSRRSFNESILQSYPGDHRDVRIGHLRRQSSHRGAGLFGRRFPSGQSGFDTLLTVTVPLETLPITPMTWPDAWAVYLVFAEAASATFPAVRNDGGDRSCFVSGTVTAEVGGEGTGVPRSANEETSPGEVPLNNSEQGTLEAGDCLRASLAGGVAGQKRTWRS